MPSGDAYIVLDSEHATATIAVLISFNQNPTTFTDWTNSTTGQSQPALRNFFQTTGSSMCIEVGIQSLDYTGAKDEANATILVQYSGGDGDLSQMSLNLNSFANVLNCPTVHRLDPFKQLHDLLGCYLHEQDCHLIHHLVRIHCDRLRVQYDPLGRFSVDSAP